jgi:hypothetical protein
MEFKRAGYESVEEILSGSGLVLMTGSCQCVNETGFQNIQGFFLSI